MLYIMLGRKELRFFSLANYERGGMKEAGLRCPLCTIFLNMWPSVFEISFIRASCLLEYMEKIRVSKRDKACLFQ